MQNVLGTIGEIIWDIHSFHSKWSMIYFFLQSSIYLRRTSQTFFTFRVPLPSLFPPPTCTRILWNSSSFIISFAILQETSSQTFRFLITLLKRSKWNVGSYNISSSCNAALWSPISASRSKLSANPATTHGILGVTTSMTCWTEFCTSTAVPDRVFSRLIMSNSYLSPADGCRSTHQCSEWYRCRF